MKIQHWSIIFLIIMIPFSIICRSVINKKMINLRDETRYNNIIDNASFDAVAQIKESAKVTGLNKNVPINPETADAAIDRFFNTLCVNFNLPFERKLAEAYFDRYIPAIIIVGYDGLYVYSCETTANGTYEFKFKPKIPYSEYVPISNSLGGCIINYTLDNYVSLYFTKQVFSNTYTFDISANGNSYGTHNLKGYVGVEIDRNDNGINDFSENAELKNSFDNLAEYPNADPFGIDVPGQRGGFGKLEYIQNFLSILKTEDELSYFLARWMGACNSSDCAALQNALGFLVTTSNKSLREYFLGEAETESEKRFQTARIYNNGKPLSFEGVVADYQYNRNRVVIGEASEFNRRRRETIIRTIVSVMREEFNEHNYYAKAIGVTYDFNIPSISREEWNNTIDDISVLAFMQGMPLGVDAYYNNYSLGGARILLKDNIVGEIVSNVSVAKEQGIYKIYHREYCKCLAGNDTRKRINNGDSYEFYGSIPSITNHYDNLLRAGAEDLEVYEHGGTLTPKYSVRYITKVPQGQVTNGGAMGNVLTATKKTTGIVQEFKNAEDAKAAGFYACTECF